LHPISDRFYHFANRDEENKLNHSIWDQKKGAFIDIPYNQIHLGKPDQGELIVASDDKNTVLYDLKTEEVLAQYPIREVEIDNKTPSIKGFSNGVALFHHNGKVGLLNDEGEEVIPAEYDQGEQQTKENFIRFSNKKDEYLVE